MLHRRGGYDGAHMTSGGVVRCSLRRGDGHIPQPGGAAIGDDIGIDLHKTKSFVTRMTAQERILEQVNLLHTTGALQQYMTALPADAHLAVEATGNWMWLYGQIEDRQLDLVLAHPLKVRAIASARIKTDKSDATTLAHLLRTICSRPPTEETGSGLAIQHFPVRGGPAIS
jgi:transposase